MKVGDLVTLSASGRKTDKIYEGHKKYFQGPHSHYYTLCEEDRQKFMAYWENPKAGQRVIGLVTRVEEKRDQYYSYEDGGWMPSDTVKLRFHVAWQANPKALATMEHIRGHLKFIKRGRARA